MQPNGLGTQESEEPRDHVSDPEFNLLVALPVTSGALVGDLGGNQCPEQKAKTGTQFHALKEFMRAIFSVAMNLWHMFSRLIQEGQQFILSRRLLAGARELEGDVSQLGRRFLRIEWGMALDVPGVEEHLNGAIIEADAINAF